MPEKADLTNAARELYRGLIDFQFTSIVTTRLMPLIYIAGIIFAGLAALYLVVSTWSENSWPARLMWTGVFAPALFIGVVVAWRVVLELCFSLFQLLLHVQAMREELREVSGAADEIVADLPRIQFWRGTHRYKKPKKDIEADAEQ